MTISLPEEVVNKLRQYVEDRGTTISGTIRIALQKEFKNVEDK